MNRSLKDIKDQLNTAKKEVSRLKLLLKEHEAQFRMLMSKLSVGDMITWAEVSSSVRDNDTKDSYTGSIKEIKKDTVVLELLSRSIENPKGFPRRLNIVVEPNEFVELPLWVECTYNTVKITKL